MKSLLLLTAILAVAFAQWREDRRDRGDDRRDQWGGQQQWGQPQEAWNGGNQWGNNWGERRVEVAQQQRWGQPQWGQPQWGQQQWGQQPQQQWGNNGGERREWNGNRRDWNRKK